MHSVILRIAARFLLPLLIMFSIVVLLQGHNRPGGGFVGGLVCASAFGLYAMAYGPARTRRLLRVEPVAVMALGLLIALLSGVPGMFAGGAFLQGVWATIAGVKVGTPLVFDVGVYFSVAGVALTMLLNLAESGDVIEDETPEEEAREAESARRDRRGEGGR